MTDRRRITVLGSTGSVGAQAVDVALAAPDRFQVVAVCAGGRDVATLVAQAVQLRVAIVGVARESARAEVLRRLAESWPGDVPAPMVVVGSATAEEIAAAETDIVLNAVDGAQGLRATLAALDAGRTVALANKESLVAGGELVLGRAKPGQLVPVDSEHSALAQCLRAGSAAEVRRLIVTASGGPFRGRTRPQLTKVTPADALAHPTWDMGRLISTNSATLVNKGLEVIEAHLLFAVPYDRIAVVVHPQSIVHSMVEFVDGSTVAQASPPDMRLPIALALGWPERVADAARPVDWSRAQNWTFEPLDDVSFPAVELARAAGKAGGCAPAVYNAANEELVTAFHDGRLPFLGIDEGIAEILAAWPASGLASSSAPGTVEEIEAAQSWAAAQARSWAAVVGER